MAIYISGVKGLPEQVQANKEDIAQIKEDIENIDFDAIRQLEAQVGENTQDINNLENGQGVQDLAINGLRNRTIDLEAKTQKISYDEQADELTIDTDTTIKRLVISTPNTPLRADSMVSRDDNNAISLTGANDEISLIVGRNGTQHILKFNADGSLDIDGQAVGGKPLYTHNITLLDAGLPYIVQFSNGESNPYTYDDFASYLYSKNIRVGGNNSPIQQKYATVNGTSIEYYIGVYSDDGVYVKSSRQGGAVITLDKATSNFNDIVYEL